MTFEVDVAGFDVDERLMELESALPRGTVLLDPAGFDAYRWDRALDPDAAQPLAVVRPESTQHVQQTLRWATRHRVPVVPRGAGSGLSGGASGVAGGIVLSTERMRAVHIDTASRTAVAQPGALNVDVKQAAAALDLWYPPDPSSFEICSIGGNVATNAGGLCCVKYGVTSDYVLGLEVVLSDGTAVRLGGPRLKDTAGLSLPKLFVGSEGTLGIITEVTLRLLPLPSAPRTLVAWFATAQQAAAATLTITGLARPSMLEYMDATAINAVEDRLHMGLDRTAAALLVVQTDTPGSAGDDELEQFARVCREHSATDVVATSDPTEGAMFVEARRAAIPSLEHRGRLLLEDVGVPLSRLPDLVDGIERVAQHREVTIGLIAHAGDGNTHPLIVFDPADRDMTARARTAFGEIMDLAISLGGTITGEHGVGRLKKPWLRGQVGDEVIALSRRVKDALDPLNILNPGALLP